MGLAGAGPFYIINIFEKYYNMQILKINEWMQVSKPHYTTTSTVDNIQDDKTQVDNLSPKTKEELIDNLSPKTKEELGKIIEERIKKEGYDCDLNDIDVSNITDMKHLFEYSKFNGHIENWDVSNVKDMSFMFYRSDFNGDISNWNVSNVMDMSNMFNNSHFNNDISKWDVSRVVNMDCMFANSDFDQDISAWDVENVYVYYHRNIFKNCPMENKLEYQPKFKD